MTDTVPEAITQADVRQMRENAARAVEGLRRETPYDHNPHPCTTTMKRGAAAIRALPLNVSRPEGDAAVLLDRHIDVALNKMISELVEAVVERTQDYPRRMGSAREFTNWDRSSERVASARLRLVAAICSLMNGDDT